MESWARASFWASCFASFWDSLESCAFFCVVFRFLRVGRVFLLFVVFSSFISFGYRVVFDSLFGVACSTCVLISITIRAKDMLLILHALFILHAFCTPHILHTLFV